ncbi:50S ribosomal protein L22 [bacterium BMS3Abin03]|jgi:large subunit ribosomal protein L22|nr:50S ribosomal protein L22 [bacterium BMS3Abin03]
MEARAVKRYIPSSPRKMRLVIDLIRGKSVEEALDVLHYNPKHASRVVELTLKSAVSNLSNKSETGKVEEKNIFVKQIFVNGGPVLKRVMPAPQGRAFRKRKRSNHLTIIVEESEQK